MSVSKPSLESTYRALMRCSWDAIVALDSRQCVVEWNRRAQELFGWRRDEVLGREVSRFLMSEANYRQFDERLQEAAARSGSSTDGSPQRLQLVMKGSSGVELPVELAFELVDSESGKDCVIQIRDRSEMQAAKQQLTQQALEASLLHQITMLASSADSFEEAAENALRIFCNLTGWPLGHVWIAHRDPARLQSSGVWHFHKPVRYAQSLMSATSDMSLGKGEGFPGRVWENEQPLWITDVRQDDSFIRRNGCAEWGLRGVFAFPVLVHSEVAAVIEFFATSEMNPDPQLLLVVEALRTQLGRVIERQRWEEDRGRLAAIVESSSDAILAKSLDNVILSWNEGSRRLYGYTAEEAVGRDASFLLPAEPHGNEVKIVQAVRSGQNLSQIETVRRHKDGTLMEISLTISPIQDTQGKLVGVAAISRDIGPLKRSQREVQEREARIRLLLDSTGQAMYGIDLEGNCTFCNRACLELLGYESEADLLGRNMHSVAHHSRRDGSVFSFQDCPVQQCIRTGESTHSADDFFWRADGSSFPVAFWSSPIYHNGRVDGAVVVFDDMTGQRRAEQERVRLADIVDSSYDAIIGRSLDGTIVSWNRGAERTYGYSAEEAIGRTIHLILPRRLEITEPNFASLIRHGEPFQQFETLRRRKDGSLIDVSLTVSPTFDVDGCLIGVSTIERDITQRKQREQELHSAKEAAESANRAKSEFLANISHELRTPMNAMVGMVELSLGEQISPLVRDYLQTASESTQVLLSLVNDLLDFSRMEAGRFEIEPEPFHLRQLLDEAMRTLSLRAHERGLELACYVEADVPDHLEGDGRRLRQIVINLAGNSIKFTEQGEVVVHVMVERRDDDEVTLRL
ncbi:MAG: PAS domain S-box protein, partial [Planctomycetales bacterium]|nr:PAS domain S-box protein [Planctomycetales bacterium]